MNEIEKIKKALSEELKCLNLNKELENWELVNANAQQIKLLSKQLMLSQQQSENEE